MECGTLVHSTELRKPMEKKLRKRHLIDAHGTVKKVLAKETYVEDLGDSSSSYEYYEEEPVIKEAQEDEI